MGWQLAQGCLQWASVQRAHDLSAMSTIVHLARPLACREPATSRLRARSATIGHCTHQAQAHVRERLSQGRTVAVVEPAINESQVQRPNHCATQPH